MFIMNVCKTLIQGNHMLDLVTKKKHTSMIKKRALTRAHIKRLIQIRQKTLERM